MIKSADRCFRACVKNTEEGKKPRVWIRSYLTRELVSKESGLWQFVCENNLAPIMCTEEWIKHYYKDIDDDNLISGENIQPTTEYEYRLIESALCDEDKLEEFLLQNIKIGNE